MDEMEYYIDQHRQSHALNDSFNGKSLVPHIAAIDALMRTHGCDTILDYGCGKAQCWPTHWQGRITGYDPAYGPYSARPTGQYDMVICTDVMEHVPQSAVAAVIQDIFAFRVRWAYFSICVRASNKTLPDGTNKHVTIRPRDWWDLRLRPYDRYTVAYTQ